MFLLLRISENEREQEMTMLSRWIFMMLLMANGKTAGIPADKSRTGGFIDLDEEIEELMLNNGQVAGVE